jgi:hypothetical protein
MFYGTRTGLANLPGGRNAAETVRLMRASGLPFEGGLLLQREPVRGAGGVDGTAHAQARAHPPVRDAHLHRAMGATTC